MHAWLLVTALLVAAPATAHTGVISGKVTHRVTGEPVPQALVILQCSCLQAPRERLTDAEGLYRFGELPAGAYTIEVLAGNDHVLKFIELPPSPPPSAR
jgi:Carboxypeptidase regulatory-like domain